MVFIARYCDHEFNLDLFGAAPRCIHCGENMKLTKKQRSELKMLFGGYCAYCGCELGDKWHADHVEPLLRGYCPERYKKGADEIDNLFPACVSCNISKMTFSIEEWRKFLMTKVDKLNRYEKNFRLAVAFGQVEITPKPIVFYFEKFEK